MALFLHEVSQEYNVVAFHNFTHVYSVFQLSALCM